MKFSVRKALISDVNAIAIIHVNSWQVAFEGLMPKGYINGYTLQSRKVEWLEIIKKQTENVIVVENENCIVGFLSFSHTMNAQGTLELSKLYLCPSIYGEGAGNLLMEQLDNKASTSGIKVISLYVLDCNQAAIKFYSKHGFEFGAGRVSEEYEGEIIVDIQMVKHL